MGQCKTEMQKTKTTKKGNWFNRSKDPMEVAKTFADHLDVSNDMIDRLCDTKKNDCDTEGASERPTNELKLNLLKAMRSNIQSAQELVDQYANL